MTSSRRLISNRGGDISASHVPFADAPSQVSAGMGHEAAGRTPAASAFWPPLGFPSAQNAEFRPGRPRAGPSALPGGKLADALKAIAPRWVDNTAMLPPIARSTSAGICQPGSFPNGRIRRTPARSAGRRDLVIAPNGSWIASHQKSHTPAARGCAGVCSCRPVLVPGYRSTLAGEVVKASIERRAFG